MVDIIIFVFSRAQAKIKFISTNHWCITFLANIWVRLYTSLILCSYLTLYSLYLYKQINNSILESSTGSSSSIYFSINYPNRWALGTRWSFNLHKFSGIKFYQLIRNWKDTLIGHLFLSPPNALRLFLADLLV